jgi:hypothetical protein
VNNQRNQPIGAAEPISLINPFLFSLFQPYKKTK